jgi:integrase
MPNAAHNPKTSTVGGGIVSGEANTPLPLKGDFQQMARRRFQRGSVFMRGKRNPVWVARWRESVIGSDSKEIRVQRKEVLGSKKDFPTKRLAERELEARLSSINSLTYRGLRSASFAEFVAIWQNNALPQLKPSTQPPIRSQIAKWLLPYFGKLGMKDISGQMIQMLLLESKLSPKSCRNLVATLRIMWKSAKGWGYVMHDPFSGLVLPKPEPAEQPHFSIEQAKQIISLAKPPFNIAFWLIYETGIRRGEVCALNVGHVDLPNRTIVVRNSRSGNHITANKSRRPRVFSLSPQLAEALVPIVTGRTADMPLFLSTGGKRLHPDNFVKRELKPILKTLGLNGALHAFRHGNATALDRMNVPMKVRQERLGHVEVQTTLGYTHLVSEDDRLLSEKLGKILSPSAPNLDTEQSGKHLEGLLIQ